MRVLGQYIMAIAMAIAFMVAIWGQPSAAERILYTWVQFSALSEVQKDGSFQVMMGVGVPVCGQYIITSPHVYEGWRQMKHHWVVAMTVWERASDGRVRISGEELTLTSDKARRIGPWNHAVLMTAKPLRKTYDLEPLTDVGSDIEARVFMCDLNICRYSQVDVFLICLLYTSDAADE